jgi:hypothetical protein
MGAFVNEYPDYIHIDADPTVDDVRVLLNELAERQASEKTASLFAHLSVVPPNYRLALNLKKALNVLAEKRVNDVLKDGLTPAEVISLMELDRKHFSEESRTTARSLLNVKERWLMSKAMSGTFARSRASNAYIDVELERE